MLKRSRVEFATAVCVTILLFGTNNLQAGSFVLRGTLITPDQTIDDGSLVVVGEKIKSVGVGAVTPGTIPVLKVDGVILPGMIDLHDHITWNVFPRWRPGRLFSNRYEWQETDDYARSLKNPESDLVAKGLGCDADLFGEVKALAGGATSIVGSYAGRPDHPGENTCVAGLARNLDFNSPFGTGCGDKLRYEVFPFEVPPERMDLYRRRLAEGSLACLLVHLAEGAPNDASAHREFRMLRAQGLMRKGVVAIHAVALKQEDFKEMAANGVAMIWSPRSNIELYGDTARIGDAKKAGVTIALGPDWSPTGSAGVLQELRYAAAWNSTKGVFDEHEMVAMTTSVPAGIAGLADSIGSLKPGLFADLLVLKRTHESPLKSILDSSAAEVELVIVGGTPVFGDRALMEKLLPGATLEEVSLSCGVKKSLYLGDTTASKGVPRESWAEIAKHLSDSLQSSGTQLGPFECQ